MKITRRALLGTAASSLALAQTANSAPKRIDQMPDYKSTGSKLITNSTPAADGFHFPAEWDRHEYTLMVMPPPQNWLDSGIAIRDVRDQWARVANRLNEYEPVVMVVRPQDVKVAKRLLSRNIEIIDLPVNDGWSRDSGPMFVIDKDGNRRVAGFTFNGWGGKFPPYTDDALLKARLCRELKHPMYPVDLVLEGGAVALDGEGTVITTEQCLLNKNRIVSGQSQASRVKVENALHQSLGTKKVIWLGKGLEPDPVTDGHIDGLAAFVAPGVVMLHTTDDRSNINFRICQDAKRRLLQTTDAKGRKLKVIEVPLDAKSLSHLNFYIANDAVLVPVTRTRSENARPLAIIREAFPKRKVIGIVSEVLAEGGGGIHCITQQVPSKR